VLDYSDYQAADNVDDGHYDAGDCVAAHVFAGAVHRAIEFSFLRNFSPASARFLLCDQAGVQIGVDRHLLARHGIECETGAYFGDSTGALGNDSEIDNGQDHEHNDTNRVIASDQEMSERLDHLAGGIRACMPFGQYYTGRSHVQRQPQHGTD